MACIARFPSWLHDKRSALERTLPARQICFSSASAFTETDLLAVKTRLRELSARSDRGLLATSALRGEIEETQVTLERCSSRQLDFEALEGRWRMIYTNTRDVVSPPVHPVDAGMVIQLPVLFLGNPPILDQLPLPWPVRVGGIYQEFSSPDVGSVQNIIKIGLDAVFEDEGITLVVQAKSCHIPVALEYLLGYRYEVKGPRRIALEFKSVGVGDLKISSLTESILAPAFLPRTGLNHQLLLAIKEFSLSLPLQQRGAIGSGSTAGYLLTYLDEDMLIGRPLDTGGTFIFNKAETKANL